MHGSWLEVSADLDAGYKFNSRLFGGAAALGQTIQGVVISNGDRAGSCPGGEADQLGRSHATIREFGMRVEVDQVCRHSSILSASCRSSQFRATCRSPKLAAEASCATSQSPPPRFRSRSRV